MSDRYTDFEIIDRYGARWRYSRTEGYFWTWGAIDGSDVEDHDMVVVWLTPQDDPDDGAEEVLYFPRAAMVGDVMPGTELNLNFGLHRKDDVDVAAVHASSGEKTRFRKRPRQ